MEALSFGLPGRLHFRIQSSRGNRRAVKTVNYALDSFLGGTPALSTPALSKLPEARLEPNELHPSVELWER